MFPYRNLFPDGLLSRSLRKCRGDSPILLYALKGYPKFQSIICFNAAHLPIIDALLLYRLSSQTILAIEDFITFHDIQKALIRSERLNGGIGFPSRQAVSANNIVDEVSEMLALGDDTVIAIQAAGNIYKNLYNLNIEFDPFQPGKISIEISGPGFTATDLNRSGYLHETIEIPSYSTGITDSLINRKYIIQNSLYQEHRKHKIERSDINLLAKENALILDANEYRPIPVKLLQDLWEEMDQLKTVLAWLNLFDTGCIVSLSFLCESNSINHYYWDIHSLQKE